MPYEKPKEFAVRYVSAEKLQEKALAKKSKEKRAWYYRTYKIDRNIVKLRLRVRHATAFLIRVPLPKWLSFLRWCLVDFLRAKRRRFWGIYQFVGLPGQGKTLSMVAHMERAREAEPDVLIATNFYYKNEDYHLEHWTDMIAVSMESRRQKRPCIVAIDEIHITFDSSNWQSFPQEMLALLSFDRKFSLQFLCSSQIYERIPKKIRDIANYTVICKNFWDADRYFINYYFSKDDYEAMFSGKKKHAKFIRDYIASDTLYQLYNTLDQVDNMKTRAKEEKAKREQAFDILFGQREDSQEEKEKLLLQTPKEG